MQRGEGAVWWCMLHPVDVKLTQRRICRGKPHGVAPQPHRARTLRKLSARLVCAWGCARTSATRVQADCDVRTAGRLQVPAAVQKHPCSSSAMSFQGQLACTIVHEGMGSPHCAAQAHRVEASLLHKAKCPAREYKNGGQVVNMRARSEDARAVAQTRACPIG